MIRFFLLSLIFTQVANANYSEMTTSSPLSEEPAQFAPLYHPPQPPLVRLGGENPFLATDESSADSTQTASGSPSWIDLDRANCAGLGTFMEQALANGNSAEQDAIRKIAKSRKCYH